MFCKFSLELVYSLSWLFSRADDIWISLLLGDGGVYNFDTEAGGVKIRPSA